MVRQRRRRLQACASLLRCDAETHERASGAGYLGVDESSSDTRGEERRLCRGHRAMAIVTEGAPRGSMDTGRVEAWTLNDNQADQRTGRRQAIKPDGFPLSRE